MPFRLPFLPLSAMALNMAPKKNEPKKTSKTPSDSAKGWREAIESIVIAIVLAFLFRAFEAEAFVIPTGSMAPTLQGRHKDVFCPECSYQYRAGASVDTEVNDGPVVATTCPMCFYTYAMQPDNASDFSHTGDRILVNKFAYEAPFGEPERWDVIVFKYPGNAKQNYIKRLVGLPNEVLKIRHGDIFVQKEASGPFEIARKPPDKLTHMLQLVHDSNYVVPTLNDMGWPLRWQPTRENSSWTTDDGGRSFHAKASGDVDWLRYRHYPIGFEEWDEIIQRDSDGDKSLGDLKVEPTLITDFYAYNAQTRPYQRGYRHPADIVMHWVGDLAVELQMEVVSDTGVMILDLVEAGRHHRCQIDLATGTATLSIDDGQLAFDGGNTEATAQTKVRGPGSYDIRFANVDNELRLWVNGSVCEFDEPTTYPVDPDARPVTSADDPGDLSPVGIGLKDAEVRLQNLKILRDIYYIAANMNSVGQNEYMVENIRDIVRQLKDPKSWNQRGNIFDRRNEVIFEMKEDQFFPLGDNSPYSRDGRLWGREHWVERDLLIGKAILIYWPHALRMSVPFSDKSIPAFPNFKRMGLIH